MQNRTNLYAAVAAAVIAIIAGAFFFYVQDFSTTASTRNEEPYKRTADAPPSAVQDETSHPALKDDKNATPQP